MLIGAYEQQKRPEDRFYYSEWRAAAVRCGDGAALLGLLHPTRGVQNPSGECSVLRLNGEYKLDAIAITINISDERYAGGIAGPGPFIRVARPACA